MRSAVGWLAWGCSRWRDGATMAPGLAGPFAVRGHGCAPTAVAVDCVEHGAGPAWQLTRPHPGGATPAGALVLANGNRLAALRRRVRGALLRGEREKEQGVNGLTSNVPYGGLPYVTDGIPSRPPWV